MRFLITKATSLLAHYLRIDAHYFFTGGVWLTIIQVITVLGALVVSAVFAHVLDEAKYGVYRYILGIGALLTSFSLTGIGQSIFQTSAQKHTWFYPLGIRKSLIYSLGITISSIIGSIYYFIQDNTELALGCLIIAILQTWHRCNGDHLETLDECGHGITRCSQESSSQGRLTYALASC